MSVSGCCGSTQNNATVAAQSAAAASSGVEADASAVGGATGGGEETAETTGAIATARPLASSPVTVNADTSFDRVWEDEDADKPGSELKNVADEAARGGDTPASGAQPPRAHPGTPEAATEPRPTNASDIGTTSGSTGGWNAEWEAEFTRLQLAPEDMEFLRTSGLTGDDFAAIAKSLSAQPLLDASGNPMTAGNEAGSASGGMPNSAGWTQEWDDKYMALLGDRAEVNKIAAAGLTPEEISVYYQTLSEMAASQPGAGSGSTDVTGQGQGQTASAWSPAWESKFRDVLKTMGVSPSDIDTQIRAVSGQPVTEQQLQTVYDELLGAVGDFDAGWQSKFEDLFDKLKVPADQRTQALQGIASRGLSDSELQKYYDSIAPAWGPEWDTKFKTLNVPQKMVDDLKASNPSAETLTSTFDRLLNAKLEAQKNGRLDKLNEAGAKDEDKWGVLLADPPMSDGDFEKAVNGIKSANVPLWQRGLSILSNFIPGVGLLNYALGKDLITGEHIDRTNPLNIGMAVLSAIPLAGIARGAIQTIRGVGLLGSGAAAAVAGGGGVQAALGAGNIAAKFGGTTPALANAIKSAAGAGKIVETSAEVAGAAAKLQKGLGFFDTLKASLPIINRFGEARVINQLANSAYHANNLTNTMGGILKGLSPELQNVVATASRLEAKVIAGQAASAAGSTGRTAAAAIKAGTLAAKDLAALSPQISQIAKLTGLAPGQITNLAGTFVNASQGTGTLLRSSGGVWALNPFKSGANVQLVAAAEKTGIAGIISKIRGGGAIPGTSAYNLGSINTASRAGFAHVAGTIAGGGDIIGTTANLGRALKIGEGLSGFRSLGQLARTLIRPGSEQAVRGAMTAGKVHSGAYGFAAGIGTSAKMLAGQSAAFLGAGVLTGMTGKQLQPVWDGFKERDRIALEQQEADEKYAKEQAELAILESQRNQQYADQPVASNQAVPVTADPAADGMVAPTSDQILAAAG